LPEDDSDESPMELIATIFAFTLALVANENGDAFKTETGIVHVLFDIMVELLPLQLVVSCRYVLDEVSIVIR